MCLGTMTGEAREGQSMSSGAALKNQTVHATRACELTSLGGQSVA